ncbi:MAG TPA: hypothetical protein VH062_07435 [Polyangiaceae bacterium]|jgi:hypothetical protein|nr:hypothetical protein [Polyangiaceae bacterium]
MLQIYPVILSFVADVAELVPRIAHHDPVERASQHILGTLYRLSFPRQIAR